MQSKVPLQYRVFAATGTICSGLIFAIKIVQD
jgi:hypothetical protein